METGTLGESPGYDNSFNAKKFNSEFELEKKISKESAQISDDNKLNLLNKVDMSKPLLDYTAYDILLGIKNTWFGIIDDALSSRWDINMLTKENRLYFIGITMIIIGITMIIIGSIMNFSNEDTESETIKIYRI